MARSITAVAVVASMLVSGCAPAVSRVRVGWGPGGVRMTMGAAGGAEAGGRDAASPGKPQSQFPPGAADRVAPAQLQSQFPPGAADRAAPAQPPPVAALHSAAAKIPLGAKVKVRMRSGAEVKGTLREVRSTGIVVQKPAPKGAGRSSATSGVKGAGGVQGAGGAGQAGTTGGATGVAAAGREPAGEIVDVPYEAMQSVRRDTSMGTGKKIALVAGVVAGAALLIWRAGSGSSTGAVSPGGG